MKRVTLLLVFLLVWGSCQVNLVPLISSRVDGTVLDKETRQPIAGVKVKLVTGPRTMFEELSEETVTDRKGYFKFDLSFKLPITAYLQCEKEGYIPLIPEYYLMHAKEELFDKVVNLFEIHQGKIKRSIITLEKGGTLKGKVFKRDSNGISPYAYFGGSLLRSTNPDVNLIIENKNYYVAYFSTNANGEFEIKGIEPYGDYYIQFFPKGYPSEVVRNISINRNDNPVFECTIDLTDQTGIKGTVFLGQKPVDWARVMIRMSNKTNLDDKDGAFDDADKNGNYSCLGINPGRYTVIVQTSYEENKYENKFIVDILQGVTKIMNIVLGPGDITEDYIGKF